MQLSIKTYLKFLVCIFLILILGTLIFPFYFETGNDVFTKVSSRGSFTGLPSGLLHSYGSSVILSDIYAILYKINSSVPWFELFNILYISFIITNVLFLIRSSLNFKCLYHCFQAVGILLLVIQIFIYSEPTRTGILLTGSSLLILTNNPSLNRIENSFFCFLVLVGILIRLEAGMLSFVLVLLTSWIYTSNKKAFVISLFPLFFAICALLIYINIPQSVADKNYLAIRPYQFSLWDFQNHQNHLYLNNVEDTVKLQTSKQFFLADAQSLNPDFFDKIGLNPQDKTPKYFLNYFKERDANFRKLYDYIKVYTNDFGIILVFWFFIFCFTFLKTEKKIQITLIFLLFLSSLLALAFFMKMEERLFFSIVTLNIICLIVYGNYGKSNRIMYLFPPFIYTVLLALIIQFLSIKICIYYIEKQRIDNKLNIIQNTLLEIKEPTVVFIILIPLIHWDAKYYQNRSVNKNVTLVPYDNGLYFIQEEMNVFLKKQFGCSEFECVSNEVLKNRNTYIISDKTRLDLMSKYLGLVYKIDFQTQKIITHTSNQKEESNTFDLYQVVK